MKKVINALCATCCFFTVFGQNNIQQQIENAKKNTFVSHISPFKLNPNSSILLKNEISNKVFKENSNALFLSLDDTYLQNEVSKKPTVLNLSVPVSENENIELELIPVNFLTPDFKATTSSGEKISINAKFYQGIIKGSRKSMVAVSIFSDGIQGLICDSLGNRILKKVEINGKTPSYCLYFENQLADEKSWTCGVEDIPLGKNEKVRSIEGVESAGCKYVDIHFQGDYTLYQNKGSNVTTTFNYLLSLFYEVALIYRYENIAIGLSGIHIWNTPDPYAGTTACDLLGSFRANNPIGFNQMGHLITGKSVGGGCAYLGVLCNRPNAFGVSQSPFGGFYNGGFSSSATGEVAHELGHNFGSRHTHACVWNGNNTAIDNCNTLWSTPIPYEGSCSGAPQPAVGGGTIMSYCHGSSSVGINYINAFGPQPGTLLRNNIAANTCIPVNNPTVANLFTSNTETNSATVGWELGFGSNTVFTVRYIRGEDAVAGTTLANWTVAGTTTSTSFTINGLESGVIYLFGVTGDCSPGQSSPSSFGTLSHCKPIYGANSCNQSDGINSFTFNGESINTNTGCSPNGYGHYQTPVINVTAGENYNFSLGLMSASLLESITIWIDTNKNGVFEVGEKVFNTITDTGLASGSLSIPTNSHYGRLKMRVRLVYGNFSNMDPCSLYAFGETEDYILNIQSPCKTNLFLQSPPGTPTSEGIDYNSLPAVSRQASSAVGMISATNKITGTANVTYQAKSVVLNPGFMVSNGAIFKGETGGCNYDPSLIVSMPFDGNSNDISRYGLNAVFNNATLTTGRKGVTNTAYSFNGINQRIELGRWFNYQQFTISMWVNAGATQSNAYAMIIDNNHRANIMWNMQQNNTVLNQYDFGISGSPGTGVRHNLTPNQWTHIVIVVSMQTLSIYVNGILSSSNPRSGNIIYDGSQRLSLGAWVNFGTYTRFWNGKMDDLKIYNRAISPSEVTTLFNE